MNDLNEEDNVDQLPAKIALEIRDYLDVSPQKLHALIAALDGEFTLVSQDVWAGRVMDGMKLLNEVSARGMTIQQFAFYASKAQDAFLMGLLRLRVPITIREFPRPETFVMEGEVLSLVVTASGYPLPNFQWYKDGEIVPQAFQNTYMVQRASGQDIGKYQCAVYNSQNLNEVQLSPETTVYVYRAAPPEISVQPSPCRVELGGNALFRCEVLGDTDVTYQWFKDDIALDETPQVKGPMTNELRLYNIDHGDWQGCYYCEVAKGSQSVRSQGAPLQIFDHFRLQEQTHNYTATDKVALLIGCNDYRGDKLLSAPKFDVQTLTQCFHSLSFKVVSLLNLSKVELISAIHQFKQLVGEGVYCVFYFCGHGFESTGQGFESPCFLVPYDAPQGYDNTHCVAADEVFGELLEQKPAICCMILDICRKRREDIKMAVNCPQDSVQAGNSIVCYGTSRGLSAFESKEEGILVSHLKKFLHQPISIEEVFQKLREELGKDPRVNDEKHKQIADVKTNLTEPRRSFNDKIKYNGFTSQFDRRREIWERAHFKPEQRDQKVKFPTFDVKVRLTFQQEFSNVLKIYVSVIDPGPAVKCTAYVSQVPKEVAEKADIQTANSSSNSQCCSTYVSIQNIQRLKKSMNITLTVNCDLGNGQPPLQASSPMIDLELPLVASLELWRERPALGRRRVAVEQEELLEEEES